MTKKIMSHVSSKHKNTSVLSKQSNPLLISVTATTASLIC
jgi:hypothetical protein